MNDHQKIANGRALLVVSERIDIINAQLTECRTQINVCPSNGDTHKRAEEAVLYHLADAINLQEDKRLTLYEEDFHPFPLMRLRLPTSR